MTHRQGSPDFAPVGEPVISSRPLIMHYQDENHLIAEMQGTMADLEKASEAIPDMTEVHLGRIRLLGASATGKRNSLEINYSERADGRANALLNIVEDGALTRLRMSPDRSCWAVEKDRKVTRYVDNPSVIGTLDTRLKNSGLDPLMDRTDFDAIEIPRLLAASLHNRASIRKKKTVYAAGDALVQGLKTPDYIDDDLFARGAFMVNRENQISSFNFNGRSIFTLSTSAPYNTGESTTVQKTYSFTAEVDDRYVYDKGGEVSLRSFDGVSKSQLDRYHEEAEYAYTPHFVLYGAMTSLREQLLNQRSAA